MAEQTAVTTKKKKRHLSLRAKNALKGLVFVTPFIIGLIAFFIYPIFFSLRISIAQSVEIIGMKLKGITFYQYKRAFVEDTEFVPTFLATVKYTLTTFPLTIILSLIIAILLNKEIKGRGLFRVIFFIPFLLGSGEIMRQLLNQGVDRAVLNIADGRIIPYNVLSYFGSTIVDVVQGLFGTLVTVLWRSGVQILLFLAGLQSISPALYEAARIDGATEWELFWKVTVPMISPMMLLTLVYTIVDSFTSIDNKLLAYIKTYGFANAEFSYASALGWIYFAFIGILVAIIFGIMKKYMHTSEVEEVRKRERKHRVITIEKARRTTY
ncbi:MAG: sugar ABC transporter permease [Lachnospiraceae bacterium]|nr:sugar ABC transporter permease [Lachnospiraceae bacterium]MBR5733604.1 sugar ABC transporter permease [Lachnospiraceae bacterium]